MKSWSQCYAITKDIIPESFHRYKLKRLTFSLRLFLFYADVIEKINHFFMANQIRSFIFSSPGYKIHLYKQQIRSSFYRGSTAKSRWKILCDHFLFLENTHSEKSIKQFHTDSALNLPFVIQRGDAQLTVKIFYQHEISHEGFLQLAISMNKQEMCKITFWFMEHNGLPTLCIGALQGGKETLEANRNFTKEFWGLRPQNMALTMLRWYAQTLDIKQIYTLPKEKCWCKKIADQTVLNELWQEQGAVAVVGTPFINIAVDVPRKHLNDIATRKRSMYKKRYDFLDGLHTVLALYFDSHLSAPTPVAKKRAC